MSRASRRPTFDRGRVLRACVAIVFFCAAPTAGDIGSCSQSEDALDPIAFFANKQAIDCEQCKACGLGTKRCATACKGDTPDPDVFPSACAPLVHDGEVCLDALVVAGCDDYAGFMADSGATAPTECDFCPAGGP